MSTILKSSSSILDAKIVHDDQPLLAAMKAGETWALAALYERHAPVVYGYCRNLVKDQVKAEALLEESFFKFWQHRSHLRSPINGALDCLLALAFQVAGGAHQKVLERN